MNLIPKANTKSKNDADMSNAHEGFRDIVDLCAKKKLNREIPNSATCHAAYLLYKLLKGAAKHKYPVRIISGQLKMSVYNQLVGVLERCEKSGVEMDVVVLEDVDNPNGENEFYMRLQKYDKAKCYKPNNANKKAIADSTPHMLIVGKQGFRYETDTKTHSAIANFNNPDFVDILNAYFDQLIESNAFSPIDRMTA